MICNSESAYEKKAANLSAEAIAFAKEFETASEYGKAIIRCVLQQERKNRELKSSLKRYMEEFE